MADHINLIDNHDHKSKVRVSSPTGGARRPGRIERAVAVVSLVLSFAVLAALFASEPTTVQPGEPVTTQAGPSPERGDPVLAQKLVEQALGADPQARLRLLLAARVVAPDRATHRIALAQAMLGAITPVRLIETKLDAGGSIGYAALSVDASFMITNGAVGGQVWQTGWTAGPATVRLAASLGRPVTGAAGGGMLARTTLLVMGDDGASAWRASASVLPVSLGKMAGRADAIAVNADATTAVTVDATTATIWDVSTDPVAKATFPYDEPVTAVAFSPGAGLVLVAGHADGRVTLQTIDLAIARTTKRTLDSGDGPVDAVALSADGSTVAAMHQDGSLSAWDLRTQAPQPAGKAAAAGGPGPHRIWLSATGDYGFVADPAAAPTLWSLADRHAPARMLALAVGDNPAVPAMISADGATVAFIDRDEMLSLWDIKSIVDTLADPVARACQLADMTEQRWRQMVPDRAFANPCAGPAPPSLGVEGG